MKNLFAYCLTGLFCVFGCGNPQRQPTQTESRATSRFIEDVRLKTTPVKNQGNSDLCWMYAMLATIEFHAVTLLVCFTPLLLTG